jgi:ribonuclease E
MDNDQVLAVNEETAEVSEAPKKATRSRRKAIPKTQEVTAEGIPVETAGAHAGAADAGAAETSGDGSAASEVTDGDQAVQSPAPARRSRSRKKAEPAVTLPAFAEDETATGSPVQDASETPIDKADDSGAATDKPLRRRSTRSKAAGKAIAEAPDEAPADSAQSPLQDSEAAQQDPAPENPAPEEAADAESDAPESAQEEKPAATASPLGSLFLEPGSVTSMIFQAPDLSTVIRPTPAPAAEAESEDEASEDGELDESGSRRRRRSRGRRGRSRGTEREAGDDAVDTEGDAGEAEDDEQTPASNDDGVTSRRRRRRRRGDQDIELTGGGDDDPPNTVTRVRAPRAVSEAPVNRVTSVKGSTRLEAKKQRRRESRDTGRRRTVITEAEFLARRESVDRQMIVRQRDDRIQIAVLEDGVLAEHFVSKTQQDSLIGNVYLGKVQNVLPSMEAAFVDIGRGRNAVLYAGEVNWDVASLEGKQRRIENALKSGDSVLVQVTKDPVGHKGARLTSQISLPGRYLVYVPGGSMTGISRKLPDVERNRLKRILKDRLPEDAGVIVRTAAEGASEEELTHDINRLRAQWEGIESQATSTKVLAPELLYGEPDLTIKVVRDVFNEDFSKLIVSGEEAWDTIEAYVTYVAPDLVGRLEKWTKDPDIFSAWRIDEQIHKALDRKVFLPSGGSLVIDRTEAMTVVDVNTGKFTGSGGNLEETVTKNNLEAAEEVVRQLRLRDIGGIIVIDFIDMVLESNRDLVLRRMVECLGRDRTKHQVAEVTSLGLVQMTRKRMGTGLLEVFGEQCEHCAGRGVVTHDEPVEHRRANVVAAEHYIPRAEIQSAPRTERKRRRGKGGSGSDGPLTLSAPAHPEPTEAERHAKAEATRAALANIAAAAHAAHLHDDDAAHAGSAPAATAGAAVRSTSAGQTPSQPSDRSRPGYAMETKAGQADSAKASAGDAAAAHTDQAAGRPAAVLTFGGEKVVLPYVEHADEATAAPALTLDLLAEAFAHLGDPADQPSQQSAQGQSSQQSAQAEGDDSGAVRGRRSRRNRSASRAQGAANETTVEHSQAVPAEGGSVHAAKAPAEPAKPAAAASEPIILGVGVPASEL